MDFFDKLTKKATETYKGAAEKTGKIAKEAKLKMKINENKSKIEEIYEEIGKKVYQKHTANEELCIKKDLEEECAKIDILSAEIETYHKEILDLSDAKSCVNCKETIDKNAKFCPNCGTEQPQEEQPIESEGLKTNQEEKNVEETMPKEEKTEEDEQKEQELEAKEVEVLPNDKKED